MYLLFRYKKWELRRFIEMGMNERKLTKIFLEKEMEDIQKEHKEVMGVF